MVVRKFTKVKDVIVHAQELGFNLNLANGRVCKSKKINGATWFFEGFIHNLAEGMCKISLCVRGGEVAE